MEKKLKDIYENEMVVGKDYYFDEDGNYGTYLGMSEEHCIYFTPRVNDRYDAFEDGVVGFLSFSSEDFTPKED